MGHFNGTRTTRRRWRNLITGECRLEPPLPGELDWGGERERRSLF